MLEQSELPDFASQVQFGLLKHCHRMVNSDHRLVFDVPDHGILGYVEKHNLNLQLTETPKWFIFPKKRTVEVHPEQATFSVKLSDDQLLEEKYMVPFVCQGLVDQVICVVQKDRRTLGTHAGAFRFVIWEGCRVDSVRDYTSFETEVLLKLRFKTLVCGPLFPEAEVIDEV